MTDTGTNNENNGGIDAIQALLANAEPVPDIGEADPFEVKCARYAQNDFGNGERLRARYGRDLMFVRDIGWHAWVQTHWSAREGERMAIIFAQETAKAILDEAKHLKVELIVTEQYLIGDGEPARGSTEDRRVARLLAWALKSGDIGKSRNMLDAAQPYLTAKVDDLDADPYLFNVQNGTLHLKAFGPDGTAVVLKKHSRKNRITKLAPVVYDQDADCEVFHKFLESTLPDQTVAGFMQVYSGYGLTGDVSERKLVMALGVGSNGKSTLIGAIAGVMGDYAMSLPIASLMSNDRGKSGSDASPDLAQLPGARMVSCAEPERGAKFSEGLIKQMTGGTDMMKVRHLNQGFFEFLPTHKLFISMNLKPLIRGQDQGIWDRIALVMFGQRFEGAGKDKTLPDKLKAERSGILNWLVDGFRVWNERGLEVPAAVTAATEEYRSESDKVGQFIAAALVRAKGKNVNAKRLYDAFTRWCKLNAEDPMTNTAFGRALGERGYHKEKVGIMFYVDIDLVDDFLDAQVGALDAPPHDGDGR